MKLKKIKKSLIGSFLAPYAFPIAASINMNPYLILIIFSVVGPISIMLLKETLNVPMKDEI